MRSFAIVASLFVFAACASAQCPVTVESNTSFVPPSPYKASAPGGFLHGTVSLWTWVSNDPDWWRGPAGGAVPYMAKLVYWRAGFDMRTEPDPGLTIIARRLDAEAPLVNGEHASAVQLPNSPGSMAMMTGIDLPTWGCWQITAHYKNEALITVVSLKP
jgi:hypothetical protein